ncbi:MAG: ribosome small subunit-dependent GTPase A [Candidatus Merdivicinus sp.]
MKIGMIRKALSGFYYVLTDEREYLECKAKGVFRKEGKTPLVGDRVSVENDVITEIFPRKNEILRPPAANLDFAVMVVSAVQPQPNTLILDKLIAVCEKKEIEPILVFTKGDLGDSTALQELYRNAGFQVFSSIPGQTDYAPLLEKLAGKISIFIGNSGVGKSTLMNALIPDLSLQTAEISDKLGRGRHTTRHVELYELPNGGLVADSPGFSTVEIEKYGRIRKEELAGCFREFDEYADQCQFPDCSHRVEKGCAVLKAISEGKIASSRHESYCAMYEDAQQIKEWEEKRR